MANTDWKFFHIWKHRINKLFSSGNQTILNERMCFFYKDNMFHAASAVCASQVGLTLEDALHPHEEQNCIHLYFMLFNINICLYIQHKSIYRDT